jgi:TolA-binding protein
MSDHEVIQQDEPIAEATEPHDGAEGTNDATEKMVPVGESIRYRRRAQAAEQKLSAMQGQLDELQAELAESREALVQAEKRRRIDQLLTEAEAIDLPAARLLTEAAVEQMSDGDVADAVSDLRRHKPYLFRQRGTSGGSLSPRPRHAHGQVDEAAAEAANSGDRRDLLRYLRLRRQA